MSSGAVAEAPAGARESAPGGGAAGAAAASVAAAALGAPVAAGAALPDVLCAAAIDPGLADVLLCIADCVGEIGEALRSQEFDHAGSTNSFGDEQLEADIFADNVIFRRLRACPAAASASSEETASVVPLSETGAYSVAFDPLDGSSIVGANFAVGSIFGIWRGATPLGQTGRAQAAAVYSVYGPRTLLVVAYEDARGDKAVQQFVQQPLHKQQQQPEQQQQQQQHYRWALQRAYASLRRAKVVAPANLRAAAGNAAYRALVDRWILDGRKLRYSGGMVPDVHHILVKGGGVFCNPSSAAAPAKLRLLYECAPLAYMIEAAGGASHCGRGSVLDLEIPDTGARTTVALGAADEVAECLEAMAASHEAPEDAADAAAAN